MYKKIDETLQTRMNIKARFALFFNINLSINLSINLVHL